MSVLDGFVRMRLYRERASEFELLAETEDSPDVRLRYRIVASHYRELVEREEKADKARMAELIERARLQPSTDSVKSKLASTFNRRCCVLAPAAWRCSPQSGAPHRA
jgi:hypothetical protein